METITKDGILNSNELYLLQNFEANLVALNLKIAEQENKKNEVTCLFDTLSKTDSVSKINSKKDYAEKINKISKKFVNNIEKLNSLKSLLIDINSDFASLSKKDFSSDENVKILKEKINNYFSTYEEIKNGITKALTEAAQVGMQQANSPAVGLNLYIKTEQKFLKPLMLKTM